MTAAPDIEQLVSDWLGEEAQGSAPDRVLVAVRIRVGGTKQRRSSAGRSGSMVPTVAPRTLAAALVIAAAVLGGTVLVAAPGPQPTPSPSSSLSPSAAATSTPTFAPSSSSAIPPLTEVITSAPDRLTLRYPTGWRREGATGLVLPSELHYSPDANQGIDATFTWSSELLADGQPAEQWLRAQTSGCPGSSLGAVPQAIEIGAHVGQLLASECPILGERFHYRAVVVVGNRGYTFHMDSRVSSIDQAVFAAILENVSFDL